MLQSLKAYDRVQTVTQITIKKANHIYGLKRNCRTSYCVCRVANGR